MDDRNLIRYFVWLRGEEGRDKFTLYILKIFYITIRYVGIVKSMYLKYLFLFFLPFKSKILSILEGNQN